MEESLGLEELGQRLSAQLLFSFMACIKACLTSNLPSYKSFGLRDILLLQISPAG
jgi:hypothetical protein